jgi:hypothetical protein
MVGGDSVTKVDCGLRCIAAVGKSERREWCRREAARSRTDSEQAAVRVCERRFSLMGAGSISLSTVSNDPVASRAFKSRLNTRPNRPFDLLQHHGQVVRES